MNRKILVTILLISLSLFSTHPVVAEKVVENSASPQQIESRQLDKHAQILTAYLATHDSPLEYHAQDFIDAAKEFDLDWKLVAAISGVESTFGKAIPGGYNAWGWGAYDAYHAVYFASWRKAIFTVSQGLRENYINKGYTEPYSMNRIYAASPTWGSKVTYFMQDLDRFAQRYETENQSVSSMIIPDNKIAAVSGKLVMR